ncbi:DUF302 domain-containing protein [Thalassobaculum sp.]|uniref:DUF302 domain-containing protein n=1 Tax=Thalassobaculum sp. TaxID=2022740 RepID=UPI0032EC30B4
MEKLAAILAVMVIAVTPAQAIDGWVVRDSSGSTAETADRLVAAVEQAGATVFARVDHAAGAKAAGDDLDPTVLVIFGNPKIGTPIIKADRRAALDLPLRVLIWEEDGVTRIGYENPNTLKTRYGIMGADEAFAKMAGALEKLTTAASK